MPDEIDNVIDQINNRFNKDGAGSNFALVTIRSKELVDISFYTIDIRGRKELLLAPGGMLDHDLNPSIPRRGKGAFDRASEQSLEDTPARVDHRRRSVPLPNPDKPRWADDNRPKKQINVRLPRDLIEELDQKSASENVPRNDLIEAAVRLLLEPK